MPEPWRKVAGGLLVIVRLTPKSGADRIDGIETMSDGVVVLKARVRAVPAQNAANAALEALLAKAAGVPKSAVAVAAGGKARLKTLKVSGDPVRLAEALRAALAS